MHHPTDRIAHTTAFVTPVVEHWLEREIGTIRVICNGDDKMKKINVVNSKLKNK